MRKEIVFAIVGGLIIGLVIAFGIWRANTALSKKGASQKETSTVPQNPQGLGQVNSDELKITLASPTEADVVTSSPLLVSGISKKNSWIVVTTADEDYIVKTDENGAFKESVGVVGGINQTRLTVFDETHQKGSLAINVVYSTEFAKEIEENETDEGASTTTDAIREKVQEKLEVASLDPKFYLGTVTNKTNDTLQVKNLAGEIQFVSVEKDKAAVVKIAKVTSNIKYDDIAIGDFIAALGFKNGNGVLKAKRILVTAPPEETKISTIMGETQSIKGREVIVTQQNASEIKLEFPSRWKGPEIKSLSVGDLIIATGTLTEQNLKVRTIYVALTAPSPIPTPKE